MSEPITYLEQCRKLAREAEITASASVPSAVTGQTGQLLRVVGWVSDAWKDIQNRHDNWKWMRRAFTLNTVASQPSYEYGDATDVDATGAIERFRGWWAHDLDDPFRCYLQSSGVAAEYRLTFLDWETFKWIYGMGTQNSGKPCHVSVDHQLKLHLGPKPNDIYVVSGDFQRGAQVLADDGDEPDFPPDYHDLIWRWAIKKYAANAVAREVYARADDEATRTMKALERTQLSPIILGTALA